MGRYALLIAAGEYEDQTLSRLRAPDQDVDRLAAILEDPDVGRFDSVRVLRNPADQQIRGAVEDLLADRFRDDLVLLYFSCHGIVDTQHRLYFATTNTLHTRPASTAISRTFVNEQLEACPAAAKVLILDCCYSGAFAEGFKSRPASALEGRVGRGYVVMSASDAYEYAYEADSITAAAPVASVFTDVLIEGLSSGAADLDGDQRISVDELFRYTFDGVQRRRPNQTPRFWANDAELNIYLGYVERHGAVAAAGAEPGAAKARPSTYNRHQVVVASGLRAAADRVRLMLGPLGRRILVQAEDGTYVETDDPRTFTARYRPVDPRDQLGASYVAEIVSTVKRDVGDGAATAVVLAQAMVNGAGAALRAGANPIALARGVEAGRDRAIEQLAPLASPVTTKEELEAYVAKASRDAEVAAVIAEAMDRVGKDGVVTVEESNTFGLELQLTEGTRLDSGYISPYFVTDNERAEAVLEDPYILVVDQELSAVKNLLPIMEKVVQTGKPLLIVAEDLEGEALATLVVNKIRGVFKSVAVKAPGSGDHRRKTLNDLAVLTGAQVVGHELTLVPDSVGLDSLGRARKVVVTREETTIIDAAGDWALIQRHVARLRTTIDEADSDSRREELRERLAKLAGGVAVILVGAATEAEVKERKRQVEEAVRAARAAVALGLLPGGGVSLCRVAPSVAPSAPTNDRDLGVTVVAEALNAPYLQILANAGLTAPEHLGTEVDVIRGVPADLRASGVFDSYAVLRSALTTAVDATVRFLRVA